MNLSNLDPSGILLLFIGLMIRYLIGRRRFRRRNVAGIEVFTNYLTALAIRLLEGLFNLLGLLLIVYGVVTILIS